MRDSIIMTKYQGFGNDYLVLDAKKNQLQLQGKKVALLCQRGFGLGADGVLYGPVDINGKMGMRIFNSDGLCGFNLGEVCDTTIAFLKNPEVRISETLLAPDFPTGGEVLYDPRAIEDIYNTGRGGVKVRARWRSN